MTNERAELDQAAIRNIHMLIDNLPVEHRYPMANALEFLLERLRTQGQIMEFYEETMGQLRLDAQYRQFDLDATRREFDEYKQK